MNVTREPILFEKQLYNYLRLKIMFGSFKGNKELLLIESCSKVKLYYSIV